MLVYYGKQSKCRGVDTMLKEEIYNLDTRENSPVIVLPWSKLQGFN